MNQWYVNPINPEAVQLFEVINVTENAKYLGFSRVYSDGTAAPVQQVDLHANGMAPAIFDHKNEAIEYAVQNLDQTIAELELQIEDMQEEKQRLNGLIEVAPPPEVGP